MKAKTIILIAVALKYSPFRLINEPGKLLSFRIQQFFYSI